MLKRLVTFILYNYILFISNASFCIDSLEQNILNVGITSLQIWASGENKDQSHRKIMIEYSKAATETMKNYQNLNDQDKAALVKTYIPLSEALTEMNTLIKSDNPNKEALANQVYSNLLSNIK